MFGTVARLNVKPGKEGAVAELFDEWGRDFRPRVDGAVAGYLYHPEAGSNEYLMVVGFRDRDSYYANAQAPGQQEWYERLRENLTEDPQWEDGRIVTHWHA